MSSSLISLRRKLDPEFRPQNQAPDTFLNASTWALHMGLSSNARYQIINGLDMALSRSMSPELFRVVTTAIRTVRVLSGGS